MMLLIVINIFFCIGAVAFPFSVALTNIGFGAALLLALASGVWWRGISACWDHYRPLTVVFFLYLGLVLSGLVWSSNLNWGLHIIGRHWFWLLVPVLMISLSEAKWRNYFMVSLSVGLTLNLMFCVLQYMGSITITTVGGSGADNATGHIGHIGFGFVYGVWAAWLIYIGLKSSEKKWAYCYWVLALWSYVMVFAARGRSGYVIAFLLAIGVLIKWGAVSMGWKRIVLVVMLACMLFGSILAFGPARDRLQGAWLALSGDQEEGESFWINNGRYALNDRLRMWKTTLQISLGHPVLGVGTGGLPDAVAVLNGEINLGANAVFAHPHNQYLLALVRWGPVGLILLCVMLFYWMKVGWSRNWHDNESAPLFFLPALALVIHGLSSTAIEEHFSAVLAIVLLGVALSGDRQS